MSSKSCMRINGAFVFMALMVSVVLPSSVCKGYDACWYFNNFDPYSSGTCKDWVDSGECLRTEDCGCWMWCFQCPSCDICAYSCPGELPEEECSEPEPDPDNMDPVADAGGGLEGTISATDKDWDDIVWVQLDGSGSYDNDGSIKKYKWTGAKEVEGEKVWVDLGYGEHKFTLTVTDDDGATDSDTVTVYARANPNPEERPDKKAEGEQATFETPQDSNDTNRDHDPNNPTGKDNDGKKADPIYLKTGEYYFQSRDLSIQGRALDITIERHYRSNSEYNSCFGYGWDMNYNMKVRQLSDDDNTIVLLDGQNGRKEYVKEGDVYVRPADPGSYFVYDEPNNTFTLIKKYGTELDFDSDGNLKTIADRHGNTLDFEYDPNGLMPIYGPSEFFVAERWGGPSDGYGVVGMAYRLTKIVDDVGREIDFGYNSKGLLSSVTDWSGRKWQYYYDSDNNLSIVMSPETAGDEYVLTTYVYDDNHKLEEIIDSNDQTWLKNTYSDANDRVMSQDYGDGTFTLSYSPGSDEATVTDRRGIESKIVYNSAGSIVSETIYTENYRQSDPDSYATSYEYNSSGKMTRKILPAGNCIDYVYDANDNITGIYRKTSPSDPNNPGHSNVIATTFTYEPEFEFIKTMTDPIGNMTTYTYDYEDPNYNDDAGNLMQITYPTVDGQTPVVSFTYYEDANEIEYGQVKTITAPDGMVTKCEYYNDANDLYRHGRLWKIIVDANDTDPCRMEITTEYDYDSLGRIIEVKDPNGDDTTFAYSIFDQLTKITTPLDYVTHLSYNNCKMLSAIERERDGEPNQITSYKYDKLDNLKTITDPLSYITEYGYDNSENLTWVMDAEGREAAPQYKTQYDYDERDLLWKVTDANGAVTEYSYTANGDINDIVDDAGNVTTYEYDGFDRLICITYPGDTNEVFGYDKNSNITSYKNRNDDTINYGYDELNRITTKERPSDPNIYFSYDISGRLVDVNDGRSVSNGGGLTEYTYDRIGRLSDVNDTEGRLVSYEYDDRGLRTKLIYPDDSFITYEYDAMGRLIKIKDDSDPAVTLAEYAYDELSRRTSVTLGNDAVASYDYEDYQSDDDLGNWLEKIDNNIDGSNHIIFEYTYDNVGDRLTMKVDQVDTDDYTYDKIYQLIDVDYADSSTADYYYDSLGNRTSVDVNEGTVTNYTLNNEGLNQYGSVGGTSYSYDDNGNLTDDGTYTYTYDCENRLTKVGYAGSPVPDEYLGNELVSNGDFSSSSNWHPGNYWEISSYAWWDCGVETSDTLYQTISGLSSGKTYIVKFTISNSDLAEYEADLTVKLGGTTVGTYTSDGSHTVPVTAGSNGKIEFVGDVEDNTNGPFYLELDNVSVKEKITVDYKYDYAGRRVSKTVDATTTKYCYDGDQVIAEYDYNDVSTEYDLARKFIYGPGIDEPICMIDVVNNDTVYYYHFDGLGSIVALSDDNGNIVEQYSYDVFGEPNRVSSVGNPYFFTGRRYDDETDNYYYRARYYKPSIGRFLQTDPIGYAAGLNLYTYCRNNPLNWLDPWGLLESDKALLDQWGSSIMGDVYAIQYGLTVALDKTLEGLSQLGGGIPDLTIPYGTTIPLTRGGYANPEITVRTSLIGDAADYVHRRVGHRLDKHAKANKDAMMYYRQKERLALRKLKKIRETFIRQEEEKLRQIREFNKKWRKKPLYD